MRNFGDPSDLPYLTADMPGIGGIIKKTPEDFIVEELPLYDPCGRGSHVYGLMEKKGISTFSAIAAAAHALGVSRQAVGFAGLKDTQALTRQWISVEGVALEKMQSLELKNIKILAVGRHSNKLKLGHLAGNRFAVKIRLAHTEIETALSQAQSILDVLLRRGVPNYFGPQRFGNRRDSHILGYALIQGEIDEFVDHFLGKPCSEDDVAEFQARQAYDARQYEKALSLWPVSFHEQRRMLGELVKHKGRKKAAYQKTDAFLKRFLIAAYQSYLFNAVLGRRLPAIDTLWTGDIVCKHVNGSCFYVNDAAKEQPRCDCFAISPSGPLPGLKMMKPVGAAGELENEIVVRAALNSRNYRQMAHYEVRGERRALRFLPRAVKLAKAADSMGAFIKIDFEIDAGCYATCLLREIMKNTDWTFS